MDHVTEADEIRLRAKHLIGFLELATENAENVAYARRVMAMWRAVMHDAVDDASMRGSVASLVRSQADALAESRRRAKAYGRVFDEQAEAKRFAEQLIMQCLPAGPLQERARFRMSEIVRAVDAASRRGRPKKGETRVNGESGEALANALKLLGLEGKEEAIRQSRYRARKAESKNKA
jgi:hypothetical protein